MNTKPYHLSDSITGNFHLTPAEIKSCSNYFILYWDARYVHTLLLRSPRIIKDGVPYCPVWLDGLSENELSMLGDKTVRLSFRRLKTHITGFVLISKVKSSHHLD